MAERKKRADGMFSQKFTPKMMASLRQKALAIRGDDEAMPWKEIQDRLADDPEFKHISSKTLRDYTIVAGKPSDKVFNMFLAGKISFGILTELGFGDLSTENRDMLAELIVEQGLTPTVVAKIKAYMKDGCLMAEAVMRATGQIAPREQQNDAKQVEQLFNEKMVNDAIKAVHDAIFKMRLVFDTLPFSVFDKGRMHAKIYTTIWNARYATKDLYEKLDEYGHRYWNEILQYMNFTNRKSDITASRKETQHGDGHGRVEEEGSGVADRGEAGQAVPDRRGPDEGEGR